MPCDLALTAASAATAAFTYTAFMLHAAYMMTKEREKKVGEAAAGQAALALIFSHKDTECI